MLKIYYGLIILVLVIILKIVVKLFLSNEISKSVISSESSEINKSVISSEAKVYNKFLIPYIRENSDYSYEVSEKFGIEKLKKLNKRFYLEEDGDLEKVNANGYRQYNYDFESEFIKKIKAKENDYECDDYKKENYCIIQISKKMMVLLKLQKLIEEIEKIDPNLTGVPVTHIELNVKYSNNGRRAFAENVTLSEDLSGFLNEAKRQDIITEEDVTNITENIGSSQNMVKEELNLLYGDDYLNIDIKNTWFNLYIYFAQQLGGLEENIEAINVVSTEEFKANVDEWIINNLREEFINDLTNKYEKIEEGKKTESKKLRKELVFSIAFGSNINEFYFRNITILKKEFIQYTGDNAITTVNKNDDEYETKKIGIDVSKKCKNLFESIDEIKTLLVIYVFTNPKENTIFKDKIKDIFKVLLENFVECDTIDGKIDFEKVSKYLSEHAQTLLDDKQEFYNSLNKFQNVSIPQELLPDKIKKKDVKKLIEKINNQLNNNSFTNESDLGEKFFSEEKFFIERPKARTLNKSLFSKELDAAKENKKKIKFKNYDFGNFHNANQFGLSNPGGYIGNEQKATRIGLDYLKTLCKLPNKKDTARRKDILTIYKNVLAYTFLSCHENVILNHTFNFIKSKIPNKKLHMIFMFDGFDIHKDLIYSLYPSETNNKNKAEKFVNELNTYLKEKTSIESAPIKFVISDGLSSHRHPWFNGDPLQECKENRKSMYKFQFLEKCEETLGAENKNERYINVKPYNYYS